MTVSTDCTTDCDIYKEWLLQLFLNIWIIKDRLKAGVGLLVLCRFHLFFLSPTTIGC